MLLSADLSHYCPEPGFKLWESMAINLYLAKQ
jgi:glutathione S-transferase